MLTKEQINEIAPSTRYRWSQFTHEDYFGAKWAEGYIKQFDEIKTVYARKNLYRTVRLITGLSNGYCNLMDGLDSKHKVLREHSKQFTTAIKNFSQTTGQPISRIIKLFGVNSDWYYRNKPKEGCSTSPIGKCYKSHPMQLSYKEVDVIVNQLEKPINKFKAKSTIYYEILNQGLLYCSLSTFFKYAKIFRGNLKKDKKNKPTSSFKASRAFEWLHVDIMQVQTKLDGVQKVAFVKDNYSKAILNSATTDGKAGSLFIKNLLEDTYHSYNLFNLPHNINLVSDGGSENKGFLLDWIDDLDTPPVVNKLTANTIEFPFSNNMSESTHKIFKTEFLHGRVPLNKLEHEKWLEEFVDYYSHQRYPIDHYGLTVHQVLHGEKPDKHKFQNEIRQARKERYEANINFDNCPFVSGLTI